MFHFQLLTFLPVGTEACDLPARRLCVLPVISGQAYIMEWVNCLLALSRLESFWRRNHVPLFVELCWAAEIEYCEFIVRIAYRFRNQSWIFVGLDNRFRNWSILLLDSTSVFEFIYWVIIAIVKNCHCIVLQLRSEDIKGID